jgi:hypothetical protein
MSDYTTFLFARPSFLEGLARIFDFSGSLNQYNTSKTPDQADARAIHADWHAVGEDLWNALEAYDEELKSRQTRGE